MRDLDSIHVLAERLPIIDRHAAKVIVHEMSFAHSSEFNVLSATAAPPTCDQPAIEQRSDHAIDTCVAQAFRAEQLVPLKIDEQLRSRKPPEAADEIASFESGLGTNTHTVGRRAINPAGDAQELATRVTIGEDQEHHAASLIANGQPGRRQQSSLMDETNNSLTGLCVPAPS